MQYVIFCNHCCKIFVLVSITVLIRNAAEFIIEKIEIALFDG